MELHKGDNYPFSLIFPYLTYLSFYFILIDIVSPFGYIEIFVENIIIEFYKVRANGHE